MDGLACREHDDPGVVEAVVGLGEEDRHRNGAHTFDGFVLNGEHLGGVVLGPEHLAVDDELDAGLVVVVP